MKQLYRGWKTRLAKPCLAAALAFLALATTLPAGAWAQCPSYVAQWGSAGSADGQLSGPFGVAVDVAGFVYVTDLGNNRVQKFDASGTFVTKWGSPGIGDGDFNSPLRVAADAAGNVYVTDAGNNRVQKFDGNGTFITKWGSQGPGNGQFEQPHGVAVNAAGFVYVTDLNNNRIQKFDGVGGYVLQWGATGTGNGQFTNPRGVAIDAAGNVYVADTGNNRVQKFDSTGTFLTSWGSFGSGNGQFGQPFGVETDAAGNVYVADLLNSRIQKFDDTGTYLCQWGSAGSADGEFNSAIDMASDAVGNIYVVDNGNHRIQVFGTPAPVTVTVSGTVSSNCTGPLAGVTVDLLDGDGGFFVDTTDASGTYSFAGINVSANPGEVSIMAPLGFEADSMVGVQAMVELDQDRIHDFPLYCLTSSGGARDKGYWKHEANAHIKGKGKTEETYDDLATHFPQAIFNHFYENALNGIQVPGVTFIAGTGGAEPITLQDITDLLSAKKASDIEQAKMEYLAMMLNLASGKLMTFDVVSQDGATLSQALQFISALLVDGDPANDRHAESLGKSINKNKAIDAGEIPLSIAQIAYAQPQNLEFSVAPNPGSRSGQVFAFTTYQRGTVRLDVYDVAGRMVASPVYEGMESGKHRIRWEGRGLDGRVLPSGIYLARLATPTSDATLKLMRVAQ